MSRKDDLALRRVRVLAELKKETRLANDRIDRLARAGRLNESYAYDYLKTQRYDKVGYVEKRGDVIKYKTSQKGRSLKSLEAELENVKRFNEARTSTLRGIEKLQKQSYEKFKERYDIPLSREQYGEIWKDIRIQNFKKMYGSQELVNQIRKDGTGDVARYLAERVAERGKKYSLKSLNDMSEKYSKENLTSNEQSTALRPKDFRKR